MSPALRSPRSAIVSVAVVAAALGAGAPRARPARATAAPAAAGVASALTVDRAREPFADRFPNVVLKTHAGKSVRFYDDLLKGKVVVINFMYASCTRR